VLFILVFILVFMFWSLQLEESHRGSSQALGA
jgi:hypothetical protein